MLLLSAHTHNQQHYFHGAADGWQGATPLHEYNVGAACGAFWSGVADAQGIPDTTMSDGTPNGFATLEVQRDGGYALAWHPARDPADTQIGAARAEGVASWRLSGVGRVRERVHGRKATRAWSIRVDGGAWKPMERVVQPDPGLVEENVRDDAGGHACAGSTVRRGDAVDASVARRVADEAGGGRASRGSAGVRSVARRSDARDDDRYRLDDGR